MKYILTLCCLLAFAVCGFADGKKKGCPCVNCPCTDCICAAAMPNDGKMRASPSPSKTKVGQLGFTFQIPKPAPAPAVKPEPAKPADPKKPADKPAKPKLKGILAKIFKKDKQG